MSFKQISDSQEEIEAKADQDASILAGMEFMTVKIETEGVFHYLPANKGEEEKTISFDTVVSDCTDNPAFVNAMFELYKEIKKPFLTDAESGKKLTAFISAIDVLVLEYAEYAARDEHGLI